jgi:hypothetical protein
MHPREPRLDRELAQPFLERGHRAIAAGAARLHSLAADPENRPRAFSLEPNPLSSEAVVHLAPGSGLPDDRRSNLERDPLRAALA